LGLRLVSVRPGIVARIGDEIPVPPCEGGIKGGSDAPAAWRSPASPTPLPPLRKGGKRAFFASVGGGSARLWRLTTRISASWRQERSRPALLHASLALIAGLLVMQPRASAIEHEQATSGEPIVVRLIHPDRQAAAVLRLFEGCAAPHPAAALAAWKLSTREPDQLGKPLEAVISFFNPEMVREWSVLHEARFQLGFDPETGSGRWRLKVPGDDGTLTALITALRLSGGSSEAPVGNGTIAVHRLGGQGAAVAARDGGGVVLASSRAELDRGLPPGNPGPSARLEAVGLKDDSGVPAADRFGSGLPGRGQAEALPRARRAIPGPSRG
jgi:hypothetical protein